MNTTFKLSFGRPTIDKTPAAILDYSLDLTDWLQPTGSLLSSTVTLRSDGISCVVSGISTDAKKVVMVLAGGVLKTRASVEVRFATTDTPPRIDTRLLFFKIVAR